MLFSISFFFKSRDLIILFFPHLVVGNVGCSLNFIGVVSYLWISHCLLVFERERERVKCLDVRMGWDGGMYVILLLIILLLLLFCRFWILDTGWIDDR